MEPLVEDDHAAVHAVLRARTAVAHAEVDAAFSRFDLNDRRSYVGFLLAHARALSAVETELGREPLLPRWRPRYALLLRDLDTLGVPAPPPVDVDDGRSPAELLGMLYVVEGSRLGGHVLAGRVHPDFPAQYLSAAHGKGEWRLFTRQLDAFGDTRDRLWLESVVAGANQAFRRYAMSAAQAFGAPCGV